MLILSICIPSHDRFYILENTLKSIFESKSEEFEVVVVDNGSTEDITGKIKINDSRLRIIKRETPVIGFQNVNECVGYANGKYALLCLDKDSINGKNLEHFIDILKEHPELCGGYCTYGKANDVDNIDFYKTKQLKLLGYLRKHPSGDFYKTEIISDAMKRLSAAERQCAWGMDILLAECACRGEMMRYDCDLVRSAGGRKEFFNVKSFTVKPEANNLFFCPEPIINQLHIFLDHLKTLPISKMEKQKMFFHLYRRTMCNITVDYRQEMANEEVCIHYHTTPRYVPGRELWAWWKLFIRDMRKVNCNELGMSKWYKELICFGLNVGFLLEKGKCFFK